MAATRSSSLSPADVLNHLRCFTLPPAHGGSGTVETTIDHIDVAGLSIPRVTGEFWTSRQRQASPIHEVAYRACFKALLPRFFIDLLTGEGGAVYDPFAGRGTTPIEAGLMGRKPFGNDANPLSALLTVPRFFIPDLKALQTRLDSIARSSSIPADLDLTMFYHPRTLGEILALRSHLLRQGLAQDHLDRWIGMVATNRLTGHSPGFFSVYTLPPNQAVLPEHQRRINEKRSQQPDYRDTHRLILRKSRSLISRLSEHDSRALAAAGSQATFLTGDARKTMTIPDGAINLTVTSSPFLNVVNYGDDNWLRCWFNGIDAGQVSQTITMARTVEEWSLFIGQVFDELYRITRPGGWVAFEVGEVRKGTIRLDEHVVPLGMASGFTCAAIVVNSQTFTKTSNIWGISNNARGTDTNRIVLFVKE